MRGDFWAILGEILGVFPSPIGFMLTSFNFSLDNSRIFSNFLES